MVPITNRGRRAGPRPQVRRLLGRFWQAVDALIRRLLWAVIIRQRNRGAVIIRQRNQPRFLFRHLRSRGTSIKAAAGAAFAGRGRWSCANRPGLTRAYLPAWLVEKLYRSHPGDGAFTASSLAGGGGR